jgi:putative flavoprotein involved in K+ transport
MTGAGTTRYEVAIVGAGQAGLATGRLLAEQGRRFVILEASAGIGAAWRARWDSLVLFTPRRYDTLPGLEFPGDPDGYPGRDEVVDYLERYAARFDLPVEPESRVRSLSHDGGTFVLDAGDRTILADQVVVATGPFQRPRIPGLASGLGPDVFQTHSAGYRRPGDVPDGRVLVVGGGNTGYQIAAELARTHEAHLAVGSQQTPLPQRLLGRDLFWWLTRLGVLEKTVDSRIGRRASGRDTLIGSSPRRARRQGIGVHPRLVRANGRTAVFADGGQLAVDAVIWATGYAPEHSWIHLPVLGEDGRVRHRRGVTDVPGLYFVGLSWQHTRGSALLGFVGDDAGFIAAQVAAGVDGAAEAAETEREDAAPPTASVGEGQR